MKFVADLHIHSHYSRATSKSSTLEGYYQWAKIKGINVIGTGDFTHPGFFQEIQDRLAPAENGFYALKEPPTTTPIERIKCKDIPVRFCLQTEISSIYKKHGQTRKVHSVIFAPDVEKAARINARLSKIGNIASDGRPILGLDPKYLLELIRDIAPDVFLIPAHVWTPWFSIFGSKSGFDRIEECFEDLTDEIFALETGLSSDPKMNWTWSALDKYSLISNSDAHSPQKLGRECNVFDTDFSYHGIFEALKSRRHHLGTVEFYPQEGKYHFDGHRKCGICFHPEETTALNGLCPVCGRKLTIGVLNRVLTLADRKSGAKPAQAADYRHLVPLPELIAEVEKRGVLSQRVSTRYSQIVSAFGNEFTFLFDASYEDVNRTCGAIMAEGLKRMRSGNINPQPGFDGEYGIIRVFSPGELDYLSGQGSLFHLPEPNTINATLPPNLTSTQNIVPVQPVGITLAENMSPGDGSLEGVPPGGSTGEIAELNEQQQQVLTCTTDTTPAASQHAAENTAQSAFQRAVIIVAGPGTGKTRTLVAWLSHLVRTSNARPEELLAITFTNRAASEMAQRLHTTLAFDRTFKRGEPKVTTFHSLCFEIIREKFSDIMTIYDDYGRFALLEVLFPGEKRSFYRQLGESLEKSFENPTLGTDQKLDEYIARYKSTLSKTHGLDIALIVTTAIEILETDSVMREEIKKKYKYIAVDEFQDINRMQYRFLSLLLEPDIIGSVLVIGDPDQAIYGFRGSDVNLFFQFQRDYCAQRFDLSINYRSTPTITEAGSALISNNEIRSNLALYPEKSEGERLKVYCAESEDSEARFIARTIEHLVGGMDQITAREYSFGTTHFTFDDIAVLFRTKAVSKKIITTLQREGIPITLCENKPILTQPPLSHAKSLLNVLINHRDIVSLYDIFSHVIAGLNDAVNRKVLREMQREGSDLIDSAQKLSARGVIQPEHYERFAALHSFIISAQELLANTDIEAVLKHIFQKFPVFTFDSAELKLESDVVIETAREYGSDLLHFVRRINLSPLESESAHTSEKVHLLTFHAAKGLEFRVVFLAGVEEGIVPLRGRNSDIEEERRLFYVALTRAQDIIYITHSAHRQVYGTKKEMSPSRFMKEIPQILLENIDEKKSGRAHEGRQLHLFC